MVQLFMLKLHLGGWTSATPTPEFELRVSEGESMYKIGDLVYKIVQSGYQIIIQFFMLKLHFGGCMSPATQFELRIGNEERV